MANIDRDFTTRPEVERERVYTTREGGNAGWWIAGVLIVALLLIGFFAFNTGTPTTTVPVDGTTPMVEETAPAPAADPAPAAETAPAIEPAPVEPAPAEPAPIN